MKKRPKSRSGTVRRAPGKPARSRATAPFNVIVVGGNAGYLRAVQRLLKSHRGAQFAGSAGSAAEAEPLIEGRQPQLVLIDVRLPDASGFELARRVRRKHASARIVLIVAENDAEYLNAAILAGADGVACREDVARQLPDWIKAGTIGARNARRDGMDGAERAAVSTGDGKAWSRFRSTFNQAAVGIIHSTTEGWILEVNRSLCDMLGYSSSELRTLHTRDLTHPDDRDRQDAQRLELLRGLRTSFASEKRYLRKDGTAIWVNRTVALGQEFPGGDSYLIHTIEDITERKEAELNARRHARARRVLAECSHALVHAADETSLLQEMCRIVVESGGYVQTHIGLALQDEHSTIVSAASAGYEAGYLERKDLRWSPDGQSTSLTGRIIATGARYTSRNIFTDPNARHLVERARQRGFASQIGLPLKVAGACIGAISIYAREQDAFDDEEVSLLTTLADDIGYGLATLRAGVARREAEQRLQRLSRGRTVMAECSKAMVHATNEGALLGEMCRIAVESGGFRQAWIALLTDREPLRVRVAAHAGYGNNEPMAGASNWGADGRYQGLAAEAITSGELRIARNILNDPKQKGKRARALQLRYQSSIAIPLKERGTVIGAVVLHAAEQDAFDTEEIALLDGVVADLSYGVASLRTHHAREQAEQRLRESERQVREVFDRAAVGIFRSDADGVLVEANQKFCEMLGYSRDELIGRANREITHPDDRGKGAIIRAGVLAGGQRGAISSEKRYVRKDGSILWARRTVSAAHDDAGGSRHVVAVVEDLSERKTAERRFEETFDQAPVGIAHVGLDFRLTLANRKLNEMFGYGQGELLGRQFSDFSHPDDKGMADEPREQLLAGRVGQFQQEKRYFHRDGHVIWVRRTVSLARDDAGTPLYYISVMEDVTDRKTLEQRFESTFNQAAVGIVHTALDGAYLMVNRKFCEMTGYGERELLGNTADFITHPDDVAASRHNREQLRSGRISSHQGEKRYIRKDGRVIWVMRTASIAFDAAGMPMYVIRVIEDITERKTLEQQFQATFDQAAMGISHTALDGRYLRVNQKLCDITGYSLQELTRADSPRLSHPDDVDSGGKDRKRLLTGEIASHSNEKRYVRKDGRAIWVNRTESVARDAQGNPLYFIRVVEDITERKELERQFRDNFEQAAVGIAHVDFDNNYIRVNSKLCEITGYAEAELIGRPAAGPSHPDDVGSGNVQRKRLYEGAISSFSNEKRYIRKDGTMIWVTRTESLARDSEGRPKYLIRVVEDITASKSAEERYRATFDNAPMGIMHTSINGYRILHANPKLCEMLGYTVDELLAMSSTDIVHPDYRFTDRSKYHQQMSGDALQSYSSERKYLRRDGTWFWANRTISLVKDAAGNPEYYIRVIEEITERKRAEEAVAHERTLLRTILDTLPDRIYVKDVDGRFLLENAANLKVHGIENHDEIVGKTVFDLFPEGVARRLHAEDHAIIESGKAIINRERSVAEATGAVRWHLTTKVPLRDAQGKVFGIVGVNRDITERKRMEQDLRENVERFQIAARATNDVIWDWDLVNDKIWWSDGFRVQFGYQDVKPGIDSWYDGIHPDDRERITQDVKAVIDIGGKAWSGEYRFQRADGSYANVYDRGYVIHGNDGKPVRMIGAMADVTERSLSSRRRAMEHSVTRVLAEATSLDEAMPKLIHAMCESMDWAYGARWLWNDEAHTLVRGEHWSDFAMELPQGEEEPWVRLRFQNPGGLLRRAWYEKEPTWIVDIEREPSFNRRDAALKFGLRSAYSFPIIAGTNVIGVMEFFGREQRQPDDMLLQISSSVGRQIGQFIQRKQAEAALKESEQQFRQLAGNIPQVFWITDAEQQQAIYVSPAWQEISGRPLDHILYNPRAWLESVHEEDRARVKKARKAAVDGGYDENFRVVRPDGTLRWVHDRAFPVLGEDGKVYRIAGIAEDITDRKLAESQLMQLAHYDVLTSLPNRVLFYDRLKQALAQAKRNQWNVGVMFIDVDRFKNVNDTLGHAVGDKLLQQVSERLTGAVRSGDTVGRLGGDEFAIVLSNLTSTQDANLVAQKILNSFKAPFKLEGAEIYVTASVGITLYPDDNLDQDTLIRNADAAMYRAKELGRNNYQFYTPEMNTRAQELLGMENDLRRALDRNEFLLYYQPKASAATGEITGLEALLRWRHPERGLVSPAEFIPVLEETGLIVPVGEWVIEAACEQIKSWQRAGIGAVPVAVNLSARQFQSPRLGACIVAAIERSGIESRLLELEITESSLMQNAEGAISTLRYLKSCGLRISIDDFGTGYSSLGYLKRFPLDALKIDRSFVRDITVDPDDATITRAVISMAHSLGLKVIAEGVETESQFEFLAEYGCDEIQGYLFSRPMAADDCAACLREGRQLRRQPQSLATAPVVLLVDDDDDALALLKRALAKDGYQILTARNAHEALAVLTGKGVDLVISDQHMPGVPGVEFLQRIKRLHPRTVRLMTSGHADVQVVTDAINKGEIFRFLPKGMREDKLRSDVREALQYRARISQDLHVSPPGATDH